jgi:hypothetical protein
MTFQDMLLQKCYDAHLGKVGNSLGDLGPIYALIATHNWFAMLEGNHSARVHETIDCLVSAQMRTALRHWYGRSGVQMDSAAVNFRNLLSRLAGERLESTMEISLNPP